MKFNAYTRALLLPVLVAGIAEAQVPADKPLAETAKLDFAAVDKDANGHLSKQEALAVAELEGAFDALDTDHDGSVSPAEFAHWNRAGRTTPLPRDPSTAPGGSAGAQHMPAPAS